MLYIFQHSWSMSLYLQLHPPETWYCCLKLNPLHAPAWILQLLLNVHSILPVSFFPITSPFLLTTPYLLLLSPFSRNLPMSPASLMFEVSAG